MGGAGDFDESEAAGAVGGGLSAEVVPSGGSVAAGRDVSITGLGGGVTAGVVNGDVVMVTGRPTARVALRLPPRPAVLAGREGLLEGLAVAWARSRSRWGTAAATRSPGTVHPDRRGAPRQRQLRPRAPDTLAARANPATWAGQAEQDSSRR